MSKNEFLNQLSILLSDISPEEREEAIAYYREYIEDAGLENEEAILNELGTPQEVAAEIKSGILNRTSQDIPYSSNIVKDSPEAYQSNTQNSTFYNDYSKNNHTSESPKEKNTAFIILAVIGIIFLSPIWIGLLTSALGIIVGFIAAICGCIFGFGIAGGICLFVGMMLFISSFTTLFQTPLVGAALIGAGLIVAAIGILFLLLTGWLCLGVIPWTIRSISNLVHNVTKRKKEAHI